MGQTAGIDAGSWVWDRGVFIAYASQLLCGGATAAAAARRATLVGVEEFKLSPRSGGVPAAVAARRATLVGAEVRKENSVRASRSSPAAAADHTSSASGEPPAHRADIPHGGPGRRYPPPPVGLPRSIKPPVEVLPPTPPAPRAARLDGRPLRCCGARSPGVQGRRDNRVGAEGWVVDSERRKRRDSDHLRIGENRIA